MEIKRRQFLQLTLAAGTVLALPVLAIRAADPASDPAPTTANSNPKPSPKSTDWQDESWGFDDDKPAGSSSQPATGPATVPAVGVVEIGRLSDFPKEGVTSRWRAEGFFVIRRDHQLWALSSICPHRHCKVNAQADQTYFCPCHKSTFDQDGNVTRGPARLNLSRLAIAESADGRLFVNTGMIVRL